MSYKAFISYSHAADGKLAPALQSALHRFAKPFYRLRALRVFRDKTSLHLTPELWPMIQAAIAQSEWFILLASPDAAQSNWVQMEVGEWRKLRGGTGERLLIVQTEGEIGWDDAANDFDWSLTTALPPNLKGAFKREPFYADLRWARTSTDLSLRNPQFLDDVGTIAAALHGKSKDEMIGSDIRQHRVFKSVAAAVGVLLLTLAAGATAAAVYANHQRQEAERESRIAFSRELAASSAAQLDTDPDLSVKLALEALRVSPTQQAEGALRESLARHRVLAVMSLKGRIDAGALRRDGRMFAAGGHDKIVRVWDVQTGGLLAELPGHTDIVVDVDFSPDGQRVATASWDNTARVWDVRAKRLLRTLPDHGASVTSVRFSHDGRSIATGDGKGTVRIWDAASGALRRAIPAHAWPRSMLEGATRVAFSPDDAQLLTSGGVRSTATGDPTARLWSVDTGTLVREFPTRAGEVVVSQFSRDGARVLIASTRDDPRVWDVATGTKLGALAGTTGLVDAAAFSPDGESVLTSDTNGNGAIWDARTGAPRTTAVGPVEAAAFDETGARVAVTDGNGVRVFDARSGAVQQTLLGHQGITVVLFGRAPETLITAGEDGARVWSLRGADKEWEVSLRESGASGPVFSSDGRWLLARAAGAAMLWDVATGRELARLETFFGYATLDRDNRVLIVDRTVDGAVAGLAGTPPSIATVKLPAPVLAQSADGKLVLIPIDPYEAEVRDRASWAVVAVLRGHRGEVKDAVFAPDSRWVMTVGAESKAFVWDVASGHTTHELRLEYGGTRALLSPDGRWAVAVVEEPGITVWDTATWKPRHRYEWPETRRRRDWTTSAAFSPGSALLAAGNESGEVRVLDIAAGKILTTIQAHDGEVRTIAFSANGRWILTACAGDRGARLWDVASGARVAELGDDFVQGAAFSPDGSRAATLAGSGRVRLFNLERFIPVSELVALAQQRVKRDWTPGERKRFLHETPND
jgi:WD40 repeat protein